MEKNPNNEARVTKSDPDFKKLFQLANDLAIAKNPQRWFNLCDRENDDGSKTVRMDMTEADRQAVIQEIENQLELALAEHINIPEPIRDFIENVLDLSPLEEDY